MPSRALRSHGRDGWLYLWQLHDAGAALPDGCVPPGDLTPGSALVPVRTAAAHLGHGTFTKLAYAHLGQLGGGRPSAGGGVGGACGAREGDCNGASAEEGELGFESASLGDGRGGGG
jgi:hypothetical protein